MLALEGERGERFGPIDMVKIINEPQKKKKGRKREVREKGGFYRRQLALSLSS